MPFIVFLYSRYFTEGVQLHMPRPDTKNGRSTREFSWEIGKLEFRMNEIWEFKTRMVTYQHISMGP